jgi:SAM-dependent MidA family methyltransferase
VSSSTASFDSTTECTPLVEELRARIRDSGPITFRDFMATALYHERYGYYVRDAAAVAAGRDYRTSPMVHPMFGALIARELAALWQACGEPSAFDVIEQGAGNGVLARDILGDVHRRSPAFAAAIRYRIIEPHARLRGVQQETLAGSDGVERVEWLDDLPPAFDGVLLSNELLDAFPVHRIVRRGDALLEVFVGLDGDGRFVDIVAPPSTPRLQAYFDALALRPGDGCYAEVNLDAVDWVARAGSALRCGFVLTFDYGDDAAALYAPWRRDGTLLCFFRQSASSDPYQRIGLQDITSSVDFTTLGRVAAGHDLATAGYTDQASFLTRLGIHDAIAEAARRADDMEEYFARRNAVMELTDAAGLGRIRVLLFAKAIGAPRFAGFGDAPA